jgi:DNA-binding transcriptional regulator YhcF (GntR family)
MIAGALKEDRKLPSLRNAAQLAVVPCNLLPLAASGWQ